MSTKDEHELKGGQNTTVVRIEGTVRRPIRPNSDFVHRVLTLLEKRNYKYAPRYLGIDDKGREILTFVEGEMGGGIEWTNSQLSIVMKIS